ncbi:hypothetical protein ACNOYE_31690 [Nannocystaceae bacterium ST9]
MTNGSPYPRGHVARVPDPHEDGLSAVLVPRPMGYLIVRVYFHRVPVEGLKVEFFVSNDGEKGDAIGTAVQTNDEGMARVDMLVPAIEYVCEIENQPLARVTVVHDLRDSFPLVLPIGRPYVDIDEDHEFDPSL